MTRTTPTTTPADRAPRPRRLLAAGTLCCAGLCLLPLALPPAPAGAEITPTASDADGDGLPDIWESEGVDTDGAVDLDLPALGADPRRADVFVEIDHMEGLLPSTEELDTIRDTFAAMPMENPDGSTGITIHLDAGPSRGEEYDLGGGEQIAHKEQLAGLSEVVDLRGAHSDPARRNVFHYAVFGDSYGGSGSSGQA